MADFTFAHREEGFDEHIDKSIRGYADLLDDVISLSRYFVEDATNVYDIGCSTGKLTQRMLEANQDFCAEANYVGIEIADGFYDDMLRRQDHIGEIHPWASVDLRHEDVRNTSLENASLVTSIFTLQFMSKKDRRETIQRIYDSLNEGGAFIFSEKVVCENANFQDMLTFNFYDFKRKAFATEDIMDKERTLRSMLKPSTWTEIREMMWDAGFYEVQPFWQNHMFVGGICIKN
jgi:tRNA (cmo5U34)-methyltransferase